MLLNGDSLGERQKELNIKVNEAASKNVDFHEVNAAIETCDVDKLFKIDLAAKYRNIDYILDILKSGDSLHIIRALKCMFLYEDEYSNVIASEYLHENIFPFTSIKMKKKILVNISIQVQNETRNSKFYEYCSSELPHIARKFLISTSESFKLNILENDFDTVKGIPIDYLVKESFVLANAYLEKTPKNAVNDCLFELRYLYSVSALDYLTLLENYANNNSPKKRFGLRISKDIIQHHKERVIDNLILYINVLNVKIVCKHSSSDDAKLYLARLLSETSCFWKEDFFKSYEFLLNIISPNERFRFMKKIFIERYPRTPFEMSTNFYARKYYVYMTVEEREAWALRHLDSKKELLGNGKDYLWYRFINFDKALEVIAKILNTTSRSNKRKEIFSVLIDCARDQRDLEKLFNYYYERHVNERNRFKYKFIDKILRKNNVFDFDENCWTAFNKLLYSLEVYNMKVDLNFKVVCQYRNVALLYHIIHNIDLPKGFVQMNNKFLFYPFYTLSLYFCKLSEERLECVYQYLLKYHVDKITSYDNQIFNDGLPELLRDHLHFINGLLTHFKRYDECPELVLKFMKLDRLTIYNSLFFESPDPLPRLPASKLLRLLKQSKSLVVDEFPLIEKITNRYGLRINSFLRKLKIYYSNDTAIDFLKFFERFLSKSDLNYYSANTAVNCIFQLADDAYKSYLMIKYVPLTAKIEHNEIDRNILYIQEAICRFACFSRPPVNLTYMLSYIVGDYVHYCVPMFNFYSTNLPIPLALKFVESMLDSPVSIQKHSLRLAISYFDIETLKVLILGTWNKTKNISLRMVVYTYLFKRILKENDWKKYKLYEILNSLTPTLHQDDHEDVFKLILSEYMNIPADFLGKYLETIWLTVCHFPNRMENIERKAKVIENIKNNIHVIDHDFLQNIIEDYINEIVAKNKVVPNRERSQFKKLDNAKRGLAIEFIVNYINKGDNLESNMKILCKILQPCLVKWNDLHFNYETNNNEFYFRSFCFEFINNLMLSHYKTEKAAYARANPLFKKILFNLLKSLPVYEIYNVVWKLRLVIISNLIIDKGRSKFAVESEDLAQGRCENYNQVEDCDTETANSDTETDDDSHDDGRFKDYEVYDEFNNKSDDEYDKNIQIDSDNNTNDTCSYSDIDKRDVISEMANDYAVEVGKMLKQLVDKRTYYTARFSEIVRIVDTNIKVMSNNLSQFTNYTVESADMQLLVGMGLINLELDEAKFLGVYILPTIHSYDYERETLKEIKNIFNSLDDNSEIKCIWYEKLGENGLTLCISSPEEFVSSSSEGSTSSSDDNDNDTSDNDESESAVATPLCKISKSHRKNPMVIIFLIMSSLILVILVYLGHDCVWNLFTALL